MKLIGAVVLVAAAAVLPVGQQPAPRPAVPVPAIPAILDAFRTHDVVALGDSGDQGYAFRVSLVRDPRFAQIVNDIVVEGGNALYQDVMDRYIRGENVPDVILRQAWQNTTQPNPAWDGPIYQGFFRMVRTVNGSLSPERQLRVLLGDPPIDWQRVRGREDHQKWIAMRDTYPADLIRKEVLAKGRRALVAYGPLHLQRKTIATNYDRVAGAESLIGILESTSTAKVFTVWPAANDKIQPDIVTWPQPSVALLRGTVLGATDFGTYYPFAQRQPRFSVRDGTIERIPPDQWRVLPMEEQFDAVLYLGSESTAAGSELPRELCADADYMKMRLERMALLGRQNDIDNLKRQCGTSK